ncbi:E3 ubiquitin-protein ligase SH3RF1 [Dissostichus eleginoides]|uniref:E3 ubiquitin-protein ligase SH3RF1 n=1 Tax=Dissostichus eleginoides TaxID=100907 RepID=A0AAD9FD07_DISEL|nr:E3 ubiquitin-protein ligase SH3RF1 [Dissostichus eleginoides]
MFSTLSVPHVLYPICSSCSLPSLFLVFSTLSVPRVLYPLCSSCSLPSLFLVFSTLSVPRVLYPLCSSCSLPSLFLVFSTLSVPRVLYPLCSSCSLPSLFLVFSTLSVPRVLYPLCSSCSLPSLFLVFSTLSVPRVLYPLCSSCSLPSLFQGVPQLPCAKALYNYDGKEPGDLKFIKGDIIILRRQVDENWYHGEMGGVHGFFPTNFVQVIKPLPLPPPQCKALYDFELKDKEADKDCLPFSKDDVLTVIRRVDDNWAEGMLGDKIGIFPISYVEFNSAARQLIELDKPSESSGDSGEGASSQMNGRASEKKNSKKRHSFTSLTMSHKPLLAPPPQRHSMEISGPVLISSSNPTAAARIGEISGGLSCSAPSQVHICTAGLIVTPPPSSPVTTATVFTFPSESSYTSISVDARPPPPPPPPQSSADGAAFSLAAGQRPSPSVSDQSGRQRPTVYVAMFPYGPRKEDELELRKGEMFLVLERCQDGWFKGTSMHTGKIGVFPGNYMSPVSRTASGSSQPKVPLTLASQAGRASPSSAPRLQGGSRPTESPC